MISTIALLFGGARFPFINHTCVTILEWGVKVYSNQSNVTTYVNLHTYVHTDTIDVKKRSNKNKKTFKNVKT